MILLKISTAISLKHRILATFNIKKEKILTACMPLTSPVHNRRFTVVDHYRDNQLKKDNSNNFPNL